MARRSKVTALPGPVKAAVDELLKTGRFTLDDIVAHIRTLAAEQGVAAEALPSRSALGRYAQNFERTAARMREAREVAKTWVDKIGAEPEGDVGRLLMEMLRTVAFQQLATMSEKDGDDAPPPVDISFIARAIKDLEIASRHSLERTLKVRREVEAEMKAKLAALEKDGSAGKRKLDADTLRQVREIYGIAG